MNAADILHSHQLRRTPCREGIIEVIVQARQALSENEIRERLSVDFDRTTFYRSFKTLEEANIIHTITVSNQPVKYALEPEIREPAVHPHFYCQDCHTVQCMNPVPLPRYDLPAGCTAQQTDILIKGTCAACQE